MDTKSNRNGSQRKHIMGFMRSITLIWVLLVIVSLCACSGAGTTSAKNATNNSIIYGKIDKNGTAYIPLMDGTTVSIKGDVCRAALLKDRNTIVILEQDGLLYTTSAGNIEEKTTIADDVMSIAAVASSGIIFKNSHEEYVRYLFADTSTLSLGDFGFTTAKDSLSLLYGDSEGDIYILPEDSTEPEKIAAFDNYFTAELVSADCKTAVWVDRDGSSQHTIYLYANGERYKLDDVNYKYNCAYPYFNEDCTFLVIGDTHSQNLYFLNAGDEECTKVKLGNDLYSSTIYTKNGNIAEDSSQTVDGLYVLVAGDNYANLYYISMDGDREKIASNIQSVVIADSHIYYKDEENNLYAAKLDKSELLEKSKVSGDIAAFKVSDDGNYVYYLKNCEDSYGVLSRYDAKSGESQKISTNAYYIYFYLSNDGKTIYYFEDVENIGDTYSSSGTLKAATVGSDPTKIATDVVLAMPQDGLDNNHVNTKGFTFGKYISLDSEENLIINWMYYNGSEVETIAKEVYWSVSAVKTSVTSSTAETEAATAP